MLQQQQERLAEAFRDRLGGFVREALEDPVVIEVMVNGCGRVWLDTMDRGRIATSTVSLGEGIVAGVQHLDPAGADRIKLHELAAIGIKSARLIDLNVMIDLHARCRRGNDTVRGTDDLGCRAIVLDEMNGFRLVVRFKPADEFDRGAIESIDILIIVADGEEAETAVIIFERSAGDGRDQVIGSPADILILIDEDPDQSRPSATSQNACKGAIALIHSLSLFGTTAKTEPQHDSWPPTWRLPSGAIQVDASYKEPARQKLVDKSTRAVAFLAIMIAVLGHAQWPFPELTVLILRAASAEASAAIPELAAARLIIGMFAVGIIIGAYRLSLAALGLDQGRTRVTFEHDSIVIDGHVFDRRVSHGFDLEQHHLSKQEDHRDRQQQISTPLYYRESYVATFQYGERRIEIAEILGKKAATRLIGRLQCLQKARTDAVIHPCDIPASRRS